MNKQSTTTAVVAVALGAIAISVGVLTILASLGVNVTCFNALSGLNIPVGVTFTLLGGTTFSLSLSWVFSRASASKISCY